MDLLNKENISFKEVKEEKDFMTEFQKEYPHKFSSNIHQQYCFTSTILGEGSFGIVYLGVDLSNQEHHVAIKCISRSRIETDQQLYLDVQNEVNVSLNCYHPNIVQLYQIFNDDQEYFYMVMELATGGELFDRILQKSIYTEEEARSIISILASALDYMHSKNIVHRDLKPENLLYANDKEDAALKIIDFGFAIKLNSNEYLYDTCGTPGYIAPEVLQGLEYQFSCDVWSLGVILYILLSGRTPFHNIDRYEEESNIIAGRYSLSCFEHISEEAIDLIKSMLQVNPIQRITAREILFHPWILRTFQDDNKTMPQLIQAKNGIESLRAKKRWKTAMAVIRVVSKTKLFNQFTKRILQKKRSLTCVDILDSKRKQDRLFSICNFNDFQQRKASLNSDRTIDSEDYNSMDDEDSIPIECYLSEDSLDQNQWKQKVQDKSNNNDGKQKLKKKSPKLFFQNLLKKIKETKIK